MVRVSNSLLVALSLTLLGPLSVSAQGIEARFSTEKANYLVGEPLFVILTVSNKTSETSWLEFQSPDLAKLLCDDFAVEVTAAEPAEEPWGCGFAGSCGRGLREVLPGKSITLRQLVSQQFRFRAGAYSLHAQTSIVVRRQNLFDSPEVDQVNVYDTLLVRVQHGNKNQLESAFKPIVTDLGNSDPVRRAQAAAAITEMAPPFLESVLIEMTNTKFSGSAIVALRRADTPKTRAALAQIANNSDDPMLRMTAIDNLGRTRDLAYLSTLFQLMESDDKSIENAAAEAAGTLGGSEAIPRLSTFVSSGEAEKRISGANGMGRSRAREAVPILIGLLLDSDSNVRQAAVSGLWLLTHHAALNGHEWADISTVESAIAVHQRWMNWWSSHGASCELHGMADCSSPEPLEVPYSRTRKLEIPHGRVRCLPGPNGNWTLFSRVLSAGE